MNHLVIFDLDGTLLNTLKDLAQTTNVILTRHGYPTHTEEEVMKMIGNGNRMLVKRACPEGTSDEIIDQLTEEYITYYLHHCCDITEPYPHIHEMLHELKKHGFRLAVLSNKVHSATAEIIEHYFPGIFDVAYGHREGHPHKPDPESLFEIIEELGSDTGHSLYIGDSKVDATTSINAGLKYCLVSWGFVPDLYKDPQYPVVHSTKELVQWILTQKQD
ncbi:MAG: HAD family hydrolase [Erysipelotrichaceae bacterium]|nr:HAD family hydrolase [Erysipelotrichaceae bacterium]